MRIVFIGNFQPGVQNPYSSETYHAKSLESLGHEVIKLQETVASIEQILEEGLKSDLVVIIHTHSWKSPGNITWDYLSRQLREKGVPFITYHLDLWLGLGRQTDLNDDYYQSLHHFFTVDKLMADWLNNNTSTKGHYLPPGVYDKECIMMNSRNVGYDIVFTGSRNYHKEYPYRHQMINFLHNTYGRRFLHIGNDGEVGQQRGLALNQIYADAKIAIGDTLNIGFNYPYYFSDRLTEQLGRGAFQIFPNIKGVEDLYEDKKEIVLYEHGNLEDLKSKIDYYLAHPEEREAIRRAGFERTKRDHTYVNRWSYILKKVFEESE
jgi:hypothetical protein